MSFEKPHYDAERGAPRPNSSMTPSEKFLLFRDVSFVFIILLHLGTTILAIPTLTTHGSSPASRPCLAALIVIGVLVPIFAIIGYRDRIRTSKVTSAIWFEHGWCTVFMVTDFVVAVAQSSIKGASKTSIALTWLQTVAMMVYTIGLSGMVLLQHKKFPEVGVWKHSVQSVQWLRSSETIDPNLPPSPGALASPNGGNKIKAPWQIYTDDCLPEVKLGGGNPTKGAFSPDTNYLGAHPFWQEHNQRRAAVEDDMAYIIQRYGLNIETDKRMSNQAKPKHAKRPSIRDLEISKPIPVASTVRRANTLTSNPSDAPRRFGHQRGGSLQSTRVTPSLRLDIPESTLDVPVDAVSIPESAASKPAKINNSTRSLGLAGRTLIGTSRPKASAARQHVVPSKPLPSPPPIDDSDESMRSMTSPQGSHSFVMAMAQRVQISASKVRPLMISTPKATETPFDEVPKESW